MFNRVLFALLFLVAGVVLSLGILINPFKLLWLEPVQQTLLSRIEGGHEHGEDSTENQLWTCGMHPQVIQEEPGTCPICGMALTPLSSSPAGGPATSDKPAAERKIKHWVAPMDPTYVSDKPGKSPMGMDLIPVYEEVEEDFTGVIHIDPTFVQNIGVQSVEVKRQDIPFSIRTIGTVSYNDQQVSLITTKYAGWIEDVQVNYVGEQVKKGQKLFEIYSPELVTTQKEYLAALDYAERLGDSKFPEIADRARSLLNASRERLRYWDITEDQIRDLEDSRQPRRTLAVFANSPGVVVEKMGQALDGMYVKPGMNLYRIVNLSEVWVDAEIFETQLPWLKEGQRARLEFPSQPGKAYWGAVRLIYPFFNQKTRTMKVSIKLSNPGQKLRADMYANVTFKIPSARGVLTVPENAVILSGKRNVVVLDRGEGTFQVREVVLGVNGDQVWEVREGIKVGDRVVVSSQFLIDSESNLREAISKMISSRQQSEEGNSVEATSGDGHVH